jgi:hypothetical protein
MKSCGAAPDVLSAADVRSGAATPCCATRAVRVSWCLALVASAHAVPARCPSRPLSREDRRAAAATPWLPVPSPRRRCQCPVYCAHRYCNTSDEVWFAINTATKYYQYCRLDLKDQNIAGEFSVMMLFLGFHLAQCSACSVTSSIFT